MTIRVLVSDKLSETAVQIFRDRGVEVDYMPDLGKDKDALLAVIDKLRTSVLAIFTAIPAVAYTSRMAASIWSKVKLVGLVSIFT